MNDVPRANCLFRLLMPQQQHVQNLWLFVSTILELNQPVIFYDTSPPLDLEYVHQRRNLPKKEFLVWMVIISTVGNIFIPTGNVTL